MVAEPLAINSDKTAENAKLTVDAYIAAQEDKSLLRFITCGSVDDGKSTLIGRLLYESKLLFDDQITALEADSKRVGTQGQDIDFALLVDGLASEREQGITIDVAYRFFATDARKFIVIDTPGHEQYTRNMATGASQAELAVLLIDARHGLSTQTKRHSFIVHSLGVKKLLLAINKMDLIEDTQARFEEIVADYRAFADELGIADFTAIPISALKGDNVVEHSADMVWYTGPTLMHHLDTVAVGETEADEPFRMSVQWVNRPDLDFRGYSGRVSSGKVRPGDPLMSLPSGVTSRVSRLYTFDGDLDIAVAGESVTICLEDEIDVSRGSVLAAAAQPPARDDRFRADVLWMSDRPLSTNRAYALKLGTQSVSATLDAPEFEIDVNTLERRETPRLGLNDVGRCTLSTDKPIIYAPYDADHHLGGFILIDRLSNETVALGLIRDGLSGTDHRLRAREVHVDRASRARRMEQMPFTVWIEGEENTGRVALAAQLEKRLFEVGHKTAILDADDIWRGVPGGFGCAGAAEAAAVARLMNDAGLIVLARAEAGTLDAVRDIIGADDVVGVQIANTNDKSEDELAFDLDNTPVDTAVDAVFEHLGKAGRLNMWSAGQMDI